MLEKHLGQAIHAVHLFGSAVEGGLKPLSDIDLLVTITIPLNDSSSTALMTDLLAVSVALGAATCCRALGVTVLLYDGVEPWRYPAMRSMQFGEWLRDHIQAGVFESATLDTDLTILLTKVRQHSVTLYGPNAQGCFREIPSADLHRALLNTLSLWSTEADWRGDEVNILLALVRIWYTATMGSIASKEVAATWALERLPNEYKEMVGVAREAYLGLATLAWLLTH